MESEKQFEKALDKKLNWSLFSPPGPDMIIVVSMQVPFKVFKPNMEERQKGYRRSPIRLFNPTKYFFSKHCYSFQT